MRKGLTVQPQLAHLPSPFKSCQVEQFCQSCRSVAGGQRDEEVPWVYRVIGPHWTEKSYGCFVVFWSNQGTEMGRRYWPTRNCQLKLRPEVFQARDFGVATAQAPPGHRLRRRRVAWIMLLFRVMADCKANRRQTCTSPHSGDGKDARWTDDLRLRKAVHGVMHLKEGCIPHERPTWLILVVRHGGRPIFAISQPVRIWCHGSQGVSRGHRR